MPRPALQPTRRTLRGLLRLALRVFFRPFEVAGREHVPAGGPTLLLANHFNSLVDPLVLLAVSERPLRVVAKHTLWKVPVLRRALRATRAIPVHRAGDDPEARRRNEAFFRTCVDALAAGEALAIFPEGRSHHEPAPVPLRTGAARIALAAAARGAALQVVPVGLNYDAKGTFRSGLTVLVGEPLDVLGAGDPEDPDAARRLTGCFESVLFDVVVGLPSWEEHRLLQLLAQLASPGEIGAASLARRLALAKGYAALHETRAPEMQDLQRRLEELEARCRELDIPAARLERSYTLGGVAGWLLPRTEALFLGLPLGLWGLLNNWLPYRATGIVAERFSREPDQVAMVKLLAALVVFPAFYALQTAAVAAWLGLPAAALYAVLLAPAGLYALRYWELGAGFREEAGVFVRILRHSREVARLRDERSALLARVDALARELSAAPR